MQTGLYADIYARSLLSKLAFWMGCIDIKKYRIYYKNKREI